MIKAKLLINGIPVNVLWYVYTFGKATDLNNKPISIATFLGIRLCIESRKDLNLAQWAFASNQTKQLELHIYPTILGGRTIILYLSDCHLINWETIFSAIGNQPMQEILSISAAGVKDSRFMTEYSAYWRKTFPNKNVKPTTLGNKEEEIIDCYLTDLDGNENPNLEVEKEVYVHIKTENLIGQTKDIDIANFGKTFAFNEEILKDNTLSNFNITKDLHKVKLKVIKSQDKIVSLDN